MPFGGDGQDRTVDPLLAKQVLSQLSYTPVYPFFGTLKIKQLRKEISDFVTDLGVEDKLPCLRVSIERR